jgi:hypothetical protein
LPLSLNTRLQPSVYHPQRSKTVFNGFVPPRVRSVPIHRDAIVRTCWDGTERSPQSRASSEFRIYAASYFSPKGCTNASRGQRPRTNIAHMLFALKGQASPTRQAFWQRAHDHNLSRLGNETHIADTKPSNFRKQSKPSDGCSLSLWGEG